MSTSNTRTAEIYANHLRNKFSRRTPYNSNLVNTLRQRPTRPFLDNVPTGVEIKNAVERQRNGKAPGPARVPSEAFKCMVKSPKLLAVLQKLISNWWKTGLYTGEHLEPKSNNKPQAETGEQHEDTTTEATKYGNRTPRERLRCRGKRKATFRGGQRMSEPRYSTQNKWRAEWRSSRRKNDDKKKNWEEGAERSPEKMPTKVPLMPMHHHTSHRNQDQGGVQRTRTPTTRSQPKPH